MPKKKPSQYAVVTGKGPFPLDMLRYDECIPAAEGDALLIAETHSNEMQTIAKYNMDAYHIRVRKPDPKGNPWTTRRWASFGWDLIETKTGGDL